MSVKKIRNYFNINQGNHMLEEFYENCKLNANTDPRKYHFGLKSLIGNKDSDTIYTDGVLTKAEGLSPRLLLMR